ncbi:glycosyltransferase family 4 protein [Acinetobacter sp. ANC 4648]|uniref:glycosyltransferase family 4 protein n=1 Tax=Acinetobacter sp. ANC 4648 TaxID=1977875 RepID=UPI000A35726A|nr:glycosyltransferase family 1 protein [Acinetobacter sp. ANC 4648]OTG84759.1 glycosyl transferase [Acinetobacter sp. ANC 4648]
MTNLYAEALLDQQQNCPDNFKFYFKQNKEFVSESNDLLHDLMRPRLKITIVTETWPPEINGVALSLLQFCKGLQQQGHKILLIRPEQKHQFNDFKPNKECLVKAQSIPKYSDMQFGWPQYLKISQVISDFSPNVIHIVTEGPLGFTALHVAKTKNIPVSSAFHSPFQELSRFFDLAFLVKPIQKYLCWFHNNTQLTCVPSQDTKQALINFGVTCPLVVVGQGIDIEKFSAKYRSKALRQQWEACEDTTVMLYVGRLSPEKEINVLIDAYYAIKKHHPKKIKLVIVGSGPDQLRLLQMQNSDELIFTGSLSGIPLAEAYASADVFVFASQVETFGNVVLEAMASGLPVIAYNYACAQLHVKHQVSGWLSPLGRTDQFIQYMLQLPNNKILHQMGRKAQADVQNLGWKHPIQQFEQALYQLTQETTFVT